MISLQQIPVNRNERGAVAIETAISSFVFFFILLAGVNLVMASFHILGLQHAVFKGSRYAILGGEMPGRSREESIKEVIRNTAAIYSLKLNPNQISICPIGAMPCGVDNAGLQEELVAISATIRAGVFTGYLSFPYTAQTVVRNEPF